MYDLRPRQKDAGNAVVKAYNHKRSEPVVVDATVGFGKSILIACLAEYFVKKGEKVLVLAHTEELIVQNSEAYKGDKSIFCASLNKKYTGNPVTFASEISMAKIPKMPDYTVVLIDECDRVNDKNDKSSYMAILNRLNGPFICGFTGTPFRLGHGLIYGKNKLFKSVVHQTSMKDLIDDGYLAPLKLPSYTTNGYDFKDVSIRAGKFVKADIDKELAKTHRLTHQIVNDVIANHGDRHAYMFFACSKEHAAEIMDSLPEPKVLITGEMKKKERRQAIIDIKNDVYRYIVNVNVLTVGFNYTALDTIVFMRPTESPRLFIQATGRGVRTHDGKEDCLLLDYAGNLDRHGGLDKIMTNDMEHCEAGEGGNAEYGLYCPDCGYDNKQTAHKCAVCEYYFVSQECPECDKQNAVSARHCWSCGYELIDPNNGLSRVPSGNIVYRDKVLSLTMEEHTSRKSGRILLKVNYLLKDKILSEFFTVEGKGAYYLKNINKFYVGYDVPEDNVQWYLANQDFFSNPKYIEYRKEGKYYHVEKRAK